jgi:hypothetical protein
MVRKWLKEHDQQVNLTLTAWWVFFSVQCYFGFHPHTSSIWAGMIILSCVAAGLAIYAMWAKTEKAFERVVWVNIGMAGVLNFLSYWQPTR